MKKISLIIVTLLATLFLGACDKKTQVNGNNAGFMREDNEVSLGVYPITDDITVFQFIVTEPGDDDTTVERPISFPFEKKGDAYKFVDEDQNGENVTIDVKKTKDGGFKVESNVEIFDIIAGKYNSGAPVPNLSENTILYILRSIPGTDLGDFGLYNPYDEVQEYIIGDWFHYVNLLSEGDLIGEYLIADDVSFVCSVNDGSYKKLLGSTANTLEKSFTREDINDDGESCTYEFKVVEPYIYGGDTLAIGDSEEIFVSCPWDLVDNVSAKSKDESIVSIAGDWVEAKAEGTTTVTVTVSYGGVEKTYDLEVTVVEALEELDTTDYDDERYETYYDSYSQRATMTICREDGMIAIDIMWGDSADTTHHWSYLADASAEDGMFITANGNYTIETIDDDGVYSEVVVFEDMLGTFTHNSDGSYSWADSYEDAGANCIFEKADF